VKQRKINHLRCLWWRYLFQHSIFLCVPWIWCTTSSLLVIH